jgi:FkbM family methyltransferase
MLIIYEKGVNKLYRNLLKPFSSILPQKLKIPINGVFDLQLNDKDVLKIDGNPTSYQTTLLFWNGIKGYEFHTVRRFQQLAAHANIILDIGANIGYYSLIASLSNPMSQIIAFEPMPPAYYYLKKNITLNNCKNIKVEEIALSDQAGEADFQMIKNSKFKDFPHHVVGASGFANFNHLPIETIKVSTDTLDNYTEKNNLSKIDLIKIDVEAHEHLVFNGGINSIKKYRPFIQTEILPNKIEGKIESIFNELNYSYFHSLPGTLKKVNSFRHEEADNDFYLIPKEKVEEFNVIMQKLIN